MWPCTHRDANPLLAMDLNRLATAQDAHAKPPVRTLKDPAAVGMCRQNRGCVHRGRLCTGCTGILSNRTPALVMAPMPPDIGYMLWVILLAHTILQRTDPYKTL